MDDTSTAKKKRTQGDYNLAFKLAAVAQVEKGEMTYKQVQRTYGIQGKSTVLVWLRKHGSLDWSRPSEVLMANPKETPAQRIKRLEQELENERARNLVLNEMIDIADRQHGTSIRKKYLSRQPEGFKPKAK
jgi:transposase-like protein